MEREDRKEREEHKRKERREKEDREREERREQRQMQLLTQLKEAQTAVPQQVTINQHKLHLMTKDDDIDIFVRQLEVALSTATVPQEKWKQSLLSQLTLDVNEKVIHLLEDEDSQYDEIKTALLGSANMTFAAAAECVFTADMGALTHMPIRQAGNKLTRWVHKMTEGTETRREVIDRMVVGFLRSMMVTDLKTYIDLTNKTDKQEYIMLAEQWEKSQSYKRNMFKSVGSYRPRFQQGDSSKQGHHQNSYTTTGKKPITCFNCGKLGHLSRECRARQSDTQKVTPVATPQTETKPIVCFSCQEVGHKSPKCSKKPKDRVKRIKIPKDEIVSLDPSDVLAEVSGTKIPLTLDTGADISIVPSEVVKSHEFTDETFTFKTVLSDEKGYEGKVANVTFRVGKDVFNRKAVAVPGHKISWTAALNINPGDRSQLDKMYYHISKTSQLPEADTHYLPPRMQDGKVMGAVMVSEGEVVEVVAEEDVPAAVVEPEPHSEEVTANVLHAMGEESLDGKKEEKVLVDGDVGSKVGEVECVMQEGSADNREQEMNVQSIVSREPRVDLALATKEDTTLAMARALADEVSEGYHWNQGLVFRSRLDVLGDSLEQLCLPLKYRSRCLNLAHEQFGHAGRNKMCTHIKKLFYWPSLTADVSRHCKSCETCQKHTKLMPKAMPMQERKVVSVPSERVCVDIVGPFPTAMGGFSFLLTYIDMATRWPEAIPLKKTTASILVEQLTLIFSRKGFPSTLISDNGPQFTGELFKRFLRDKGITHVKASQYHPQGNGVIERMHRTLNSVIAKCVDQKGNWAQVVPMSLYFLRCTPNRSAGVSPFMLKHGWEPTTPV